MPEENKKQNDNFIGSNCVIHDDDHGWGGPDEPIGKEKIKEKIKNPDEPMNWPWSRYRS